jgi:hypothetical protein
VGLLLAQTEPQLIIGGHALVEELAEARHLIATGYTNGSGIKAQRSFKEASAALDRYIARVKKLLEDGALRPRRPRYSRAKPIH